VVNRLLTARLFDSLRLQIRREIGTLKLLKHPNVVRLHEVRDPPTFSSIPCFFYLRFFSLCDQSWFDASDLGGM
jgi:serine/threonine protein kinase